MHLLRSRADPRLSPATAAEKTRERSIRELASRPTPRMTEPGRRDLDATVVKLADLIGASQESAQVSLRTVHAGRGRSWVLETGPRGCRVHAGHALASELDILVVEEAWWQIAESRLTPLEAYTHGMLVVEGDRDTALRLLAQVQRQTQPDSVKAPLAFGARSGGSLKGTAMSARYDASGNFELAGNPLGIAQAFTIMLMGAVLVATPVAAYFLIVFLGHYGI